jgi:geranylgeranyl diphosphate synthase type II
MTQNSDQILKIINEALASLPYDRQPASLYEPVQYVLSLGGKRIRPVLMLLGYSLFKDVEGNAFPQQIIMPAIGLETYHNYTLLHDDLMDQADLRRGHQTVHKKWNANTAILSGDSMLVLAYQRMQQAPEQYLPQIMDLFTETALEIGEGQQYDMDFENRLDVTEDEYIEMIRLKTSVLLACALKIGAILGDASPSDADLLYSVGEKLGLAFQLQDDLLDVYGDPKVFGKAIGGDITSNKKTYMLINAINRSTPQQCEELLRWIAPSMADAPGGFLPSPEARREKIKAVTRLYDEIGIRALCEQKINSYFNQADRLLANVSVPDGRKEQLRYYMAEMMHRKW